LIAAKLGCYLLSKFKFHDYAPQPITYKTVCGWLDQFGGRTPSDLFTLLRQIKYVSERETRRALSTLNRDLLRHLKARGISPKNVIYVQIDEAGSSSQWVLNMMRNDDRLQGLGSTLLDSRDGIGILENSYRLEEGAIVYVDDFIGTGNQFVKSRDVVAQNILGRWVEFLLAPYICEEALEPLKRRAIEPRAIAIHSKAERFLHPESNSCPRELKLELLKACRRVDRRFALGYHHLGSMIVFSRNCPNTSPVVIRGNKGQDPFVGLLPRTSDLPPIPIPDSDQNENG
jgi:hypothetical protein